MPNGPEPAFTFSPMIRTATGSVVYLPGPCDVFQPTHQWDYELSKVPIRAGGLIDGISRNKVSIDIQGRFIYQFRTSSVVLDTDSAREDTWETLLNALDASLGLFELYYFYPRTGYSQFRSYRHCHCTKFTCDKGNESHRTWSYSIAIEAMDPTIHRTPPG